MEIKKTSDQIFLNNYDYSASSTMNFSTNISQSKGGDERRNANWIEFMRTFDIKFSVRDKELVNYIQKFYASMFAALRTFPFKDWIDYEVEKEDGVINAYNDSKPDGFPYFKLYKRYSIENDGSAEAYKKIEILTSPDQEDPRLYTNFKLFINDAPSDLVINIDYKNALIYLPLLSSSPIQSVDTSTNTFTTYDNHNFEVNDLIYIDQFTENSVLNKRVYKIIEKTDRTFKTDTILTNVTITANGVAYKYYQDQGVKINWEGQFLNRVRFADDDFTVTFDSYGSLSAPLRLREVRTI